MNEHIKERYSPVKSEMLSNTPR